jgi:uncharacterized NAD(P)/FAD-binding protein YdhS
MHGLLNTHAGGLLEIKATRDALTARIALRRGGELNLAVDRVINCTGIEERFHKSSRPLIRALIGKGLARVNEMGVGFSTDADGAMIDAAGKTSTRIFAIGPMRNGSLLETTAVPEIRVQAEVIAQRLARST